MGDGAGRGADLADLVAAGVDDGVESPPLQGREVAVAVAAEVLGAGENAGVRAAAVKERECVTTREGELGNVAPDETSTTQDQDSHGPSLP